MRKSVWTPLTLVGMLLSSCSPPPAKMSDEELALLHKELPGMTHSCLNKVRARGVEAFPLHTEDCFAMNLPRKWRGLWSRGFEWSRFCSEPARTCDDRTPGARIWLSPAKNFERSLPTKNFDLDLKFYRIEFIGRRTVYRGAHGHLGASEHAIVVDRLLSIRPVMPERRDADIAN